MKILKRLCDEIDFAAEKDPTLSQLASEIYRLTRAASEKSGHESLRDMGFSSPSRRSVRELAFNLLAAADSDEMPEGE